MNDEFIISINKLLGHHFLVKGARKRVVACAPRVYTQEPHRQEDPHHFAVDMLQTTTCQISLTTRVLERHTTPPLFYIPGQDRRTSHQSRRPPPPLGHYHQIEQILRIHLLPTTVMNRQSLLI